MYKKVIATICIVSLLSASPIHYVRADYWGGAMSANVMQMLGEEIMAQIEEALWAALKMAAIKQATSTIENALYGGSSSPRNIGNFTEFLISDTQDAAITYGQDFLTTSLRGAGSSDYSSSSGSGGGSLTNALKDAGQGVLDQWEGKNQLTTDYAESCPAGDDFFADDSFKCFGAITSNSMNMPVGMALAVDRATSLKYEAEKQVAMITATSSGTLPDIDEDGNIKLPSSVVEAIQLQQITLPLEALANGDSGAFSSLIQSFAVSLITKVINNGMSEAQNSSKKNKDAFNKKYNKQLENENQKSGPSSEYTTH